MDALAAAGVYCVMLTGAPQDEPRAAEPLPALPEGDQKSAVVDGTVAVHIAELPSLLPPGAEPTPTQRVDGTQCLMASPIAPQ